MASSNLTTNLSIYSMSESCAISNSKFIKMNYCSGDNLRTRLSTDERREQYHFKLKSKFPRLCQTKFYSWHIIHVHLFKHVHLFSKEMQHSGGFHRVIFRWRGFLRIVQFQVDMAPLMCVSLEYAIINLCIKHPSRKIDY